MKTNPVYLKNNVVLEPLVDSWYAWSHLISPATYSLNLKNRHIPILESYIENPDLHIEAVQNPKMLGGPFMEFPKEKLADAKEHLRQLKEENRDILQLAADLLLLNQILQKTPRGAALEEVYKDLPVSLKGCVELFYDVNDNPSFRIFEPLLYNSPLYKRSSQSFKFYEITDDERTFVFSTPRIDDSAYHLSIPFDDERVDYLYKTASTPKPFEEIKERLGVKESEVARFREFFTDVAPEKYKAYDGDDIRLRYFGHACMLIESRDTTMLVDPVISYDYSSAVTRYTYKDLPDKIDYVMITHNHQDHILLETMLRLKHKVQTVIIPKSTSYLQDPSLKHMLLALGFKQVIELDEFEELKTQGISIIGIPFLGEHSDLNIRCKLCYRVTINNHRILFAADTKNISPEMYQRVASLYGDIDILFLGLECDGAPLSWLYGPLLPIRPSREVDNARRLAGSNFEEGRKLIDAFNPDQLYVYAMGQEPWLEYMMAIKYTEESNPIVNSNKLIQYCKSKGIQAERLFGEKEIRLDSTSTPQIAISAETASGEEETSYSKITI